jgi:dipeptidyl aminopeptidase/acylaminoacyl peptidase
MALTIAFAVGAGPIMASGVSAQTIPPLEQPPQVERLFEVQLKAIDDLMWYQRLGDVARIDKHRIASSRPLRVANPTAPEAGNSVLVPLYTFIPRKLAPGAKVPCLVFVHGGLHASFDTSYLHLVREFLDEGYVIVAPEYRGSTGYSPLFYDQVDYGGAEVDDVHDARDWATTELAEVDPRRVGVIGWSHGGYIALLNAFRFADDYQACYAGVPVSDLVARMGYKSDHYRNQFERFIGKEAKDDIQSYLERSPFYHAAKLRCPLLVHSTTNDEDVHVSEVLRLIDALKAAGKPFESKIYEKAPGGHNFNRIDTRLARESRAEVRAFLAKHLKP